MQFVIDVCQGFTECISEGRHGMCKVSKEGKPVCICKTGWDGENCDQKIDPMIRHYISPKLNVIRRYKKPSKTRWYDTFSYNVIFIMYKVCIIIFIFINHPNSVNVYIIEYAPSAFL